MFNEGKKIAKAITVKMFGKKRANQLFRSIYWAYSDIIPKAALADGFAADFEWMGFCCPMSDGCCSIIINPKHHDTPEEVALTIGHELAHVLQVVMGEANHTDDIFEAFKIAFCDELEYDYDSF